jgi:hypothetical protein
MIGAGPEIVHAFGPNHAAFWGGEVVLDFMFWPRTNIGWYVEPGYEFTFPAGAPHHGVARTAGLLIGRRRGVNKQAAGPPDAGAQGRQQSKEAETGDASWLLADARPGFGPRSWTDRG